MGVENGSKFIRIIVRADTYKNREIVLDRILRAESTGGLKIPDNAMVSVSGDLAWLQHIYQVRWCDDGTTIGFDQFTFTPGVEAFRFGMFRDSVLYNQREAPDTSAKDELRKQCGISQQLSKAWKRDLEANKSRRDKE